MPTKIKFKETQIEKKKKKKKPLAVSYTT
jgi:hypothetical protein